MELAVASGNKQKLFKPVSDTGRRRTFAWEMVYDRNRSIRDRQQEIDRRGTDHSEKIDYFRIPLL